MDNGEVVGGWLGVFYNAILSHLPFIFNSKTPEYSGRVQKFCIKYL